MSWNICNTPPQILFFLQIWNHPDILYNLIQKKKSITDDNDLDIETENGTGNKKKKCVKKKAPKSPQPVDQFYPPFERGQEISYEWVTSCPPPIVQLSWRFLHVSFLFLHCLIKVSHGLLINNVKHSW